MGAKLLQITPETKADLGTIGLNKPVVIKGQLNYPKSLSGKIKKDSAMLLLMYDKSNHWMQLVSTRPGSDGTFELKAQPGGYDLMFFFEGTSLFLDGYKVTVKSGILNMGGIDVAEREWKDGGVLYPRVRINR